MTQRVFTTRKPNEVGTSLEGESCVHSQRTTVITWSCHHSRSSDFILAKAEPWLTYVRDDYEYWNAYWILKCEEIPVTIEM